MNKRRFDFRWVLDYGAYKRYGPWSKPVMDEAGKASNQPRDGLLWALVEGRDHAGHVIPLAQCSAFEYVAFKFRVIARSAISIGSKGGKVGDIIYQAVGMTLVTQQKLIDVFDTGLVQERERPEFYKQLTDIGRYVQ